MHFKKRWPWLLLSLVAAAVLGIAGLSLIVIVLSGGIIRGEVPMTPAPTAASPAVSAIPDPGPAADAPAPMTDIGLNPTHIEVIRAGEVIVAAEIVAIQQNDDQELNPRQGFVGWYGPLEWQTTPGNFSEYPGVLVGHQTFENEPDVFYRLKEVLAGDVVTVTYGSQETGIETAVFEIQDAPVSVPKGDVVAPGGEYAWVWKLSTPGRVVSLITCDRSQGHDLLTGHSRNNWVVQAVRIS